MRTLAVMHIPQAGGPAQHLKPWLAALRARGPVEVIVPGRGTAASLYEDFDQVDILDYETLTAASSLRELLRQTARLLRDIRLFRRHFRSRRPDLAVLVTTVVPAALIAARLEGVPRIVYAAEIYDKRFARSRSRSLGSRLVARLVETLSTRIVCCSQTVADQFSGGISRRLVTIYPGIDGSFAGGDGPAFRRRHGLVDAAPLLAVVGNISRGRGQDLAIKALAEVKTSLPSAVCLIVGEPHPRAIDIAYLKELNDLVARLHLSGDVVFTGFTDHIADVFGAADIVINPARFNEPFGRVAIEALSAGRPVIATRVGAVPEVLSDGRDAVVVQPDNPRAIAAAAVQLWGDPDRRRRLVSEGRKTLQRRFRLETSVERFESVVTEVMQGQ
jgi:glycosyltransferase involved in cell wall biosynthesis